jgi:hypothetical protein
MENDALFLVNFLIATPAGDFVCKIYFELVIRILSLVEVFFRSGD